MRITEKFWNWYNKYYKTNLRFATVLFVLQIIHLTWMTTNVVAFRLWGLSLFPKFLEPALAFVDYLEIPAIIFVTLVYVNDIIKKEKPKKAWWYIFFLNTQWIHIFWITDEIILANFMGAAPILLPVWLSSIAIAIDYFELPVMYDTLKRSFFKKENNLDNL